MRVQKITAHAQFVEPGVRRADGKGEAENGMDERHYIEIAIAGIDGSEADSGEECDKSEARVGQVSHRENRSGEDQ